MKWNSNSCLGLSSRFGLKAISVALSVGFVVACGDDAPGGSNSLEDAGSQTMDAPDAAGTGPTAHSTAVDESTSSAPAESTHVAAADAGDGGRTTDAGGETTAPSDCGGAGQSCCEQAQCNGGFVCIELAIPEPESDAGSEGRPGRPLQPFPPLQLDASAPDAGAVEPPVLPSGMCAPCGGEGELCCEESACDEGLTCGEGSAFGTASCVPDGNAAPDGGDVVDGSAAQPCGTEGNVCCAAGRPGNAATCGDGLECDNPGGPDLDDSICVAAGGNSADASACGDLDQPCCEGARGNGVCNGDLDCESNPPRGLEGDVCVAP